MSTASSGYDHTQPGPWSLLLYVIALIAFVCAAAVPAEAAVFPVSVVLSLVGLLMLLLGSCFRHLRVADEGDRLAIRFGPIPLFQRRICYADIRDVDVGRTTLLDGWGIHMSPRGGWVWNIWGRDCVVVRHKGVLRIGTDDAENLARFLQAKVPHTKESRTQLAG